MTKLRLLVLSTLATLPVASALLVACSSSDTVITTSTEAGVTDAGTDTSPVVDASTDTGPDVFDGGFKQGNYDLAIATAMCRSLARCCYGTPTPADGGVDGGSFDMMQCVATYRQRGFDNSNQDVWGADAAAFKIDQQKTQDCVNGIEALTCNATAAGFRGLRATCFGAVEGKGAVGDACQYAVECKSGHFCKASDPDAGPGSPGVCTALRATGESCGDINNDPTRADEACTTRGSGDTNRFCQIYSDFATGTLLDRTNWQCNNSVVIGQQCSLDSWCSDGVCNPNPPNTYTCAGALEVFPSSICGQYVKQP